VPRLITFGALTPHFAGGVNISFLRNDEGEARIREPTAVISSVLR